MLDLIVLLLLLIFSFLGFFRGFKKESITIINIFIFIFLYYFFISDIEKISRNLLDINKYYYSKYIYYFFSALVLYFIAIFINYSLRNILFGFSFFSENILLNKILGIFAGFFKGFIYITAFLLLANYYSFLEYFLNLDKNSLFLDYFLQYGVQLPYVWNHWNS